MKSSTIKFFILLLSFFSVNISAETVDIKGTILDANNVPLAGAVVSLANLELLDTTGADGAYHIKGETVSAVTSPQKISTHWGQPQMIGNSLHFALPRPGHINIDLYSLNGRHIAHVLDQQVTTGSWAINPFSTSSVAKGIYLVRIAVNGNVASFKCAYTSSDRTKGLQPFSSSPTLPNKLTSQSRSTNNVFDTLMIEVQGQKMIASEITSPIATLPPRFIEQRDIYGDLGASSWYEAVDKIYAAVTKEGSSERQIAELWYNSAASSYSGYIYFVKSSTVENYSLEVLVYTGELSAVASAQIDFPSTAGDIKVPLIDISKANWYFTYSIADTISSDYSVDISDTAVMHLEILEEKFILGNIIQYYWNDGKEGTAGKSTWNDSSDTYYHRKITYDECRGYMPWIGFRTDFGQFEEVNTIVQVVSNNGTVELSKSNDNLTVNDTVQITAIGHDSDSISKWYINWKIDTAQFSDSVILSVPTENDTTTFELVMPNSVDSLYGTINYTISICDINKAITSQTFSVSVSDNNPHIPYDLIPNIIPPNEETTFDLSAITDDGEIVEYSYRIKDSFSPDSTTPFVVLDHPYTFTLPAQSAGDTVFMDIRIKDEDANEVLREFWIFTSEDSLINDTTSQSPITENLLDSSCTIYEWDRLWNSRVLHSGFISKPLTVEPPYSDSAYALSMGITMAANEFDSIRVIYTSTCSLRVVLSNDTDAFFSYFHPASAAIMDTIVLEPHDFHYSDSTQVGKSTYYGIYTPERIDSTETFTIHEFKRFRY